MSFPAYPAYSESGVPWLGDIPSHWEVMQGRRLFAERKQRALPDDEQLTASQKYGILPQATFSEREGQKVVQVITGADILKHVEPNDFVISMRSFQGGLEHSSVRGCISSAYVMLIPSDAVEPRFFKYLFKSAFYIRALQSTSNLVRDGQALRYANFAQVLIPLPPCDEQRAIASFLESDIAKIDELMAEQRRLIVLLKEKRQAVISHAVTSGLHAGAPMKDSGISWLGEVPKHWSIAKFSRVIDFQEGPGIMAADFQDDGVPLIRVAGASGRWASLAGCNYLDAAKVASRWDHFRLARGDLVISGSASMGTVCEVGPEVVGAIPYTGLMRLRPVEGETTRDFVRAIVGSSMFFTQVDLLKAGATIQHFGPTHLRQMIVPVPPLDEQHAIAEHIKTLNDQYAALVTEAEKAIGLLGERRAALISAAVTGKVDVRAVASSDHEREAA